MVMAILRWHECRSLLGLSRFFGLRLVACLLAERVCIQCLGTSCWSPGLSRPLCCRSDVRFGCFGAEVGGYSEADCCGNTYDQCFFYYVSRASNWNLQPCDKFRESEDAWLARDCLAWFPGDTQFEQTVATDIMDANFGRCFHVSITTKLETIFEMGVCLPASCSEADVLKHYWEFTDLERLSLFQVTPHKAHSVTVAELAPWRRFDAIADFVVAGFVNSGSSTVASTLQAHPEVDFALEELAFPQAPLSHEDVTSGKTDWSTWFCSPLVPRRWLEENAQPRRLGVQARGAKNPLLLYSDECVRSLSSSLPKLIVVLRDPVDWILSLTEHNFDVAGHIIHDWVRPDTYNFNRGTLLGRDHAKFGTILTKLLHTWPADRLLIVELEHLRNPSTAKILLDAMCKFLAIAPFSELSTPKTGSNLIYSPGLLRSKVKKPFDLCSPKQAKHIEDIAAHFVDQYRALPSILARVGVQELGVSATLVAGGVFAAHCKESLSLPGARAGSFGEGERALHDGRIRVAFRGEIGFEVMMERSFRLLSVLCGAGRGPLRARTWITVWEVATKTPLTVAAIGPTSPVDGGYAHSENFPDPLILEAGKAYAVTVQAKFGLGLEPAGLVDASIRPDMGKFISGVFSPMPWTYPNERDEHSWEVPYINIVMLNLAVAYA